MAGLRRNLLLAVGGAVALYAFTVGRGEHVATSVGSTELRAKAATAATTPAAAARRTDAGASASAAANAVVLLDKLELRGDRYVAPMSDGRTAVLTLDPRLQAAAEKVLRQAKAPRGAVVVTDRDGRVLALAGRRTEDPKGGPDGISDPGLALEAWAPAASIFKVVSTAAMVEAGAQAADRVCFHGGVRSVMESNLIDTKRDRRCETLSYGLAFSQNAIIAKVAHQRLEPSRLAECATRFGFGQPLALPFTAQSTFGTATIPGEKGVPFARTAAGFDGVTLSALGGAVLAGTIAAEGEAPSPVLVAAIIEGGREIPVTSPGTAAAAGAARTRVLDRKVAAEVGAMMTQTCTAGSAARAFRGREKIGNITVAGKTGTLSVHKPHYMQYSWFVGYAPADKPTLTISVLLGNAELWHMKAHTAARTVLAEGLRPVVR